MSNLPSDAIKVLDHGYVRLTNSMGSDVDITNSARTSYDKSITEMTDKDHRLLKYLITNGHWSPFRSAVAAFEVYAPLFVARQWWKHAVASSHVDEQLQWNESSRRYVTEEPVFYIPAEWRKQATDKKQGSAGIVSTKQQLNIHRQYEELLTASIQTYNDMLGAGVAIEQARMVLPQSIYVRWRWTASLQALINWYELRSGGDAQQEHSDYTVAVWQLVTEKWPGVVQAYTTSKAELI